MEINVSDVSALARPSAIAGLVIVFLTVAAFDFGIMYFRLDVTAYWALPVIVNTTGFLLCLSLYYAYIASLVSKAGRKELSKLQSQM